MINRSVRLLRLASLLAVAIAGTTAAAQQKTSQTVASRIEQIMQSQSTAGEFSGSVLVARDGRVIYQHAFGYANIEWKIPNDLQTKFEIGSMTKQFTALLALQFVNESKIRLDGHLSGYLPYYRKDTGDRVTVRELLSHTSGIPNFITAPGFLEGSPAGPNIASKSLPKGIAAATWNSIQEQSSITVTRVTSCLAQFSKKSLGLPMSSF